MDYYKKYLKYKSKYLSLKNLNENKNVLMKGGGSADTYCTLCGGPTYSKEIITNIELLKKYLGKGKYYGINPDGWWSDIIGIIEDELYTLEHSEEDDEFNKSLKKVGINKVLTLEDAKELIKSIIIPIEHKWLNNALILTENGIINNVTDASPNIEVDGKTYLYYKPKKVKQYIHEHLKNNEHYKEYNQEYREQNKDKIKEYRKANRDKILEYKNQKMICACGGKYTVSHKSHHEKSMKHQQFIQQCNV
jgi:hypothetical protein